jgi:hypothetical protein
MKDGRRGSLVVLRHSLGQAGVPSLHPLSCPGHDLLTQLNILLETSFMADRVYLLREDGAFKFVLVLHGHVDLLIINHIAQCVQIIAPLSDAPNKSCAVLFYLSDMLLGIGARFFEDLDTVNPLGELWTVAGKTLAV